MYYRAMHYSEQCGIAIIILSDCCYVREP